MENLKGEPEEILLENLEKKYYRLQFLVETGNEHLKREMEISIQAGELVGKLYDEILKLYINPENEETLKSLNMLCVRLVFCLYAEDRDPYMEEELYQFPYVNGGLFANEDIEIPNLNESVWVLYNLDAFLSRLDCKY